MDEPVLGRYRLERRLGAGGMAEVWLATDVETGGLVAVKRLHEHLAADPTMVERFRQEAAATAAVRHPNTIRVLDASWREVVLEYVSGETLAERLHGGPLPPAVARSVAADLASALAAVHAAGIVHRDVTPANVILDTEGRAHLGDFGIARPLDATGGLTATGDLIGTWRYVAPEVLAGRPASPASDVWSLGATLYEAITGRAPYPASSPAELVEARREPPPPIDGEAWTSLIVGMLHPDPAARPSADAVAGAMAGGPDTVTEVFAVEAAAKEPATQPVTDRIPTVLPPVAAGAEAAAWVVRKTDGALRGAPARTPPTPALRRGLPRRGRQVVLAAASALVAAGVALAAAAPAEPPAAAGVMPMGPFPVPSATQAPPAATPTQKPVTKVAPPAHTAGARQPSGPKPGKHPKRRGRRGPHPKAEHHSAPTGRGGHRKGGHDGGRGQSAALGGGDG